MRSEGPPAGRRRTHAHSASNQQYIAPPPVQRNFRACAKLPIEPRSLERRGDAVHLVSFRLADLGGLFRRGAVSVTVVSHDRCRPADREQAIPCGSGRARGSRQAAL